MIKFLIGIGIMFIFIIISMVFLELVERSWREND